MAGNADNDETAEGDEAFLMEMLSVFYLEVRVRCGARALRSAEHSAPRRHAAAAAVRPLPPPRRCPS